jgi:recombination protein U
MNDGKRFEADFKNSMPDNVFYYRFRDGTAAWGGSQDNTRFQQSNIADCEMFDGNKLYIIELKSHKEKSIPFSALGNNPKKREEKIKELSKASMFKNMVVGYIFNFRDLGLTYFIKVAHVECFYFHGDRKSFPLAWCQENGIELKGKKLRVNYRWDLELLLNIPVTP